MFIYIGNDNVVKEADIIAIVDKSVSTNSNITQGTLQSIEEQGALYGYPDDAKTFVITTERVYYSSFSVATLKKRTGLTAATSKLDDYTDMDIDEEDN